ncbi:acetyltransferase [Fusarium albosuccineum]|uniref:Acetyltransferase n=1 Tax=Fusarium albosuccineum TaxID=1237068 RepID=A0A8H4LM98_9HYPO|nr:acetyltransferase [Fusarium albosuccineum]
MTDLRIEPVSSADDVIEAFTCISAAFGKQTRDGIWMAMNPGWDTPAGATACAKRLADRWASSTRNRDGDLNTNFVKATLPDANGKHIVVGLAIWQQASVVDGYGDVPQEDLRKAMDLEALYPGNEAEQRYITQLDRSLHKRRIEVIKEKATASPPAAMVMDLCVVDPAFQRRGIAQKLVQWGLDEAKRRGGLEAITEASSMGRNAYVKLGFKPEGGEVVYDVDPEFKDRDFPSNLFMRTGGQ